MNARKLLSAAKAVEPVFVEDVFSTYLYTGNGSTQTITNGIDLSGKGGLVWTKNRTYGNNGGTLADHTLFDTARTYGLNSNTTNSEQVGNANATTGGVNSFTSTGFVSRAAVSGSAFVTWTFRKQAKFFDVVTYTGNGSARTIAHNLGSVPGCIIVKSTSQLDNWKVYHRSLTSNAYYILLDSTAAQSNAVDLWNSTTPTATEFSISSSGNINTNGATYVAYLFAHDAGGFGASGSDNVITCGSFTTDGSGNATVTLGYEPQFLLYKNSTGAAANWVMIDTMRGWTAATSGTQILIPNLSNAEAASTRGPVNATGFSITSLVASTTYIYIAIRRGPMKTPTTGTSVYSGITRTGTGAATTVTGASAPIDFLLTFRRDGAAGNTPAVFDRLRGVAAAGGLRLWTGQTSAEATASSTVTGFDVMDGYRAGVNEPVNGVSAPYVQYFFCRAPGFFDVVCYTGTGANTTVTHNLGVAPELWIVKGRSGATAWAAGSTSLANTEYLVPNTTAAKATGATYWNSTFPTASNLSLGTAGDVNTSSATYVAYLFATVAGVSKVFSYTGNGSSQTINCGFTGGARFVLIKRTDSTGDWYVWDSARGIVAGNDPHLSLNSAAAEVTTDDSVDTDSTGFVVNELAATNVNVNAATYIGLAIA